MITDGVPNPPEKNPCSADNSGEALQKIFDLDVHFSILSVNMQDEDIQLLSCLVESTRNIVSIDSFRDFHQYRDPTGPDVNALCVKPPEEPCKPRSEPADLVFVIDTSDSINNPDVHGPGAERNFLIFTTFLKRVFRSEETPVLDTDRKKFLNLHYFPEESIPIRRDS